MNSVDSEECFRVWLWFCTEMIFWRESMHSKSFLALVGTFIFAVVGCAFTAEAEDPPGKKLFLTNKCNSCHSVDSQQIKKTLASSKAPDLSNTGAEHDDVWYTKYLTKTEDLKGKKHAKAWTGKKEDLETLAKWLDTLVPAEKK
jgi:mono/diheme cytochrome c family protein